MGDVLIRGASIDDAIAVLAIYAPVVEHTAISFELAAPTVADMGARIERIASRYPCGSGIEAASCYRETLGTFFESGSVAWKTIALFFKHPPVPVHRTGFPK